MFNAASKLYFTVAGLGVVVGFLYVLFVASDRVGFTNLVFAGVGALGLGLAVFAYVPREPLRVSLDEPAGMRPTDATDIASPSIWPIAGAAAISLVAAGAATEPALILVGVLVGIIATFAWFGQVWGEHPSWTQAMTDRLHDRFVVPIGLPGTVVLFVGIGVISLSRLFLSISADVAPFVGAGAAFTLLTGFYLIATRNIGRQTITALAAVSIGLVLAAGVAGAINGQREFEHHGGEGELTLAASDLAFDTDTLEFPANEKIALHFTNKDDAPHNLAILEDEGGEPLFRGEVVNKGEKTYDIDPLEAGTYFFMCEVHPTQMKGTVNVTITAVPVEDDSGTTQTTVH